MVAMDNPYLVVANTALGIFGLLGLYVLAVSGGNLGRYLRARQIARRWLRDREFAAKVDELALPPKPALPPRPNAEPARFLILLQREGRLVDFLVEDIESYSNDQIGAAVRDIHRNCQKTLGEHLVLEPVLREPEEAVVEVPANYDPSAVRLTGNLTGSPPFKGTLRHHGWRIKEIKLAPPPEGEDPLILQAAEVELP
jgi:hypothetical protein